MSETPSHEEHAASRFLGRSLLGYRKRDVHVLLESQRRQLEGLARSVDRLWREKERLANELVSVRAGYESELAGERARAARAEEEARAQAARLIAEAEEQAARLRHDAGARVGDAADRLESLLRVREQLLGELRGILAAYAGLLERAEAGQLGTIAAPGEAIAPAALGPEPRREVELPEPTEAGLSPRRVELDAGPFADFAELAAFERSLARLPKVEDVYIRRFDHGRAEIELRLSAEVALVHELRRLPYRVTVTPERDDRITVEVAPAAATG